MEEQQNLRSRPGRPDAVVIGAGPNGLTAANVLADHGWSVLVLEAQDEPGGAVKTAEITAPGFRNDLFSAFYPLAAASPVMRSLELERWGLRWERAPLAVAHPRLDGTCAVISSSLDETVDSVDSFAPGDGERWRELYSVWERLQPHLVEALMAPLPPVRPALGLLAGLRGTELARFLRLCVIPLRRLAEEEFNGAGAPLLLAGNALHSDLSPDHPLSAFMGWLLCSLGQEVGFPVPRGGAAELTNALVARLRDKGGDVLCGARVRKIVLEDKRASAVELASGERVEVRRAVLADTDAPQLYIDLIGLENLPARVARDLKRFHFDHGTVKVDWALSKAIPWTADDAKRAGTIHISDSLDHMSDFGHHTTKGIVSDKPYLVFGQMNAADPTRSPDGTVTAWAYTHVPQQIRGDVLDEISGKWDEREEDSMVRRIEEQVEAFAPGFRDRIIARHVLTPPRLEDLDQNLKGGAINGGTSQLHQQLIFRPLPGTLRPRTPIRNVYLASAAAHPGGGVHGACGANAARSALNAETFGTIALGAAGAALLGGAVKGLTRRSR